MKILRFEDSIAWQKSQELVFRMYAMCRHLRDFSFRDQLQRASLSVMNNIAEGFERNTNKELLYFMYIAKGSCAETRSMLYMAIRLAYVSEKEGRKLIEDTEEISRILSGFIKKLSFKKPSL
jgi:four helix bundle protein